MAISKGITKQVAIKKEATYGVLAGATGSRLMRRVTSNFNLKKDTFQSNEIRTDYQMADFRHGVRSVDGTVSGEFSPGSYSDLFAAALAKAFVAGVAITGAAITIAASGTQYTLTRGAGSYLTDGFKVGDITRITAGTGLNADSLNKNLLITALTATVATVSTLNASTMTPAVGTAVSYSVAGKKSFVPTTGHTSDSFTVEEFYPDIAQSEVFTGCKVNTIGVKIPSSGMTTLDFGFMGKDLTQTGTTQYFTTPTALGVAGVLAGVNGVVVFNGLPVGVITDATINLKRNIANATVLGSTSISEAFDGRALVDGSFSLYFTDAVAKDAFKNETEVSLIFALSTNNTAAADFISITIPRAKIDSADKADAETGITMSCGFQALLATSGGTGTASEFSTIVVQDSLA
jgi:Phage tail tube protein